MTKEITLKKKDNRIRIIGVVSNFSIDQAMQLGKSLLDLATSEDLDELTLTFNSNNLNCTMKGNEDVKE